MILNYNLCRWDSLVLICENLGEMHGLCQNVSIMSFHHNMPVFTTEGTCVTSFGH